jgi:hypothetical protein
MGTETLSSVEEHPRTVFDGCDCEYLEKAEIFF